MAYKIFPLNDSPIPDSATWSALMSRFANDGVVSGYNGELAVTAGAGLSVDVDTGVAIVQGVYFENTGVTNLALPPADTVDPRIDLVVVRIDYIGGSAQSGLYVLTGTPAASPSAPAPSQIAGQVWEIPLAEIYVAAGATSVSASDITDRRVRITPAPHADSHIAGGSDPVTIAPSQISPQGAGSGLDADTLHGKAPDGLWTSGDASTSVDWNSVVTAGLYDLLLHGSANPNGPGVSAYFHVLVARYANVIERLLQLALPTASNGGALESIFYRGYNQQAGTWTNWREIFDTYNTAVGSNANGWYVRFPNGLQICWVVGIGMTYNMAKTWTYPAAFVAAPAVAGLGYRGRLEVHGSVSATSAELRNYDSGTSGGTHAYLIAIGRWK